MFKKSVLNCLSLHCEFRVIFGFYLFADVQFCVISSILFLSEIVSGILMFTLMDHVRGTISSHIKQAIVDYQRNERLQDFIDYVQRKVYFLDSLLSCLISISYDNIHDYNESAKNVSGNIFRTVFSY